jgi:hypothetical protein
LDIIIPNKQVYTYFSAEGSKGSFTFVAHRGGEGKSVFAEVSNNIPSVWLWFLDSSGLQYSS